MLPIEATTAARASATWRCVSADGRVGWSAGDAAAVVEETEGEEAVCANQRGWAEGEEEEATAAAGGILLLLLLILLLLLLDEALLLLFASLRRALMDDEVDILRCDSTYYFAANGPLFLSVSICSL